MATPSTMTEDKMKALSAALSQIDKQFGKGSVMRLGDHDVSRDIQTASTASPRPATGEQALEIADMLVRSGSVDVVVIDSVAALTPKAEIEGEMGDSHMGLQARLMSQALRKLTANIKRTNTLVIFINQIRMKIGVMFGHPQP